MKIIEKIKDWLRKKLSAWLLEERTFEHRIVHMPTEVVTLRVESTIDMRDVDHLGRFHMIPLEEAKELMLNQMREELWQAIKKSGAIETISADVVGESFEPKVKIRMILNVVKTKQ